MLKLCHCELADEIFVISDKGCELHRAEFEKDLTVANVKLALEFYQARISELTKIKDVLK